MWEHRFNNANIYEAHRQEYFNSCQQARVVADTPEGSNPIDWWRDVEWDVLRHLRNDENPLLRSAVTKLADWAASDHPDAWRAHAWWPYQEPSQYIGQIRWCAQWGDEEWTNLRMSKVWKQFQRFNCPVTDSEIQAVSQWWSRQYDLDRWYLMEHPSAKDVYDISGQQSTSESCMSNVEQTYFYEENSGICRMLVIYDNLKGEWSDENPPDAQWETEETPSIYGRALIWTLEDGRTYVDRVYPADGGQQLAAVQRYAQQHGYLCRAGSGATPRDGYILPNGDKISHEECPLTAIVTNKWYNFPYMDTLVYYNSRPEEGEYRLSSYQRLDSIGMLLDTEGDLCEDVKETEEYLYD
jgi:hypothetical protein